MDVGLFGPAPTEPSHGASANAPSPRVRGEGKGEGRAPGALWREPAGGEKNMDVGLFGPAPTE
ncbi:hypothetical protein KUG85_18365 (plasmid) [Nitratireductor sp. L1-7-SE]|uniref:Uncharacterized protein n=1 Tax=Nitratireductor rhodophyticola TaxID=2854036 RepID=A0ABS7RBM1_9HYPH|nr:hypothetical protein [Nitratireductor rhodophyticola]MBY8918341.1 hypothetical protein [Nitratireductor rhodophyticola]MBY8922684.1 hypothetical protein [Nitratireductor rhodophyticola]